MGKVVAFVPVKAKSQRLPGKNKALLCGLPLWQFSVFAGLRSKRVDSVVVSSDDNEVLEQASALGCLTLRRDGPLRDPHLTNFRLIHGSLGLIAEITDWVPEIVMLLQPTHPFRCSDELDDAIDWLRNDKTASAIVAVLEQNSQVGRTESGGWIDNVSFREGIKRTSKFAINTGHFYLMRISQCLQAPNMLGPRILAHTLKNPQMHCDIDSREDFDRAQALAQENSDVMQVMATLLDVLGTVDNS